MVDFFAIVRSLGITSLSCIILCLLLYVVFIFLNKQIEHIYSLHLKGVEQTISEQILKLQKTVDIVFRDEESRSQILSTTINKANEVRLELYSRTYALFFEILYSHDRILKETSEEQTKSIQILFDKVTALRNDLFINSIFLGTLVDCLLPAQMGLFNDIGIIQSKIDGTWKGLQDDFYNSSKALKDAEDWINENMKCYLSLNSIDFSKETIEKLHMQRNELINEQTK